MSTHRPIKLFTGTASKYLATKVAEAAGIPLGKSSVTRFSDGEIQPCLEETVRGDYVFIFQSTFQPVDNLFELMLMIDASSRASAYKTIAVIPYFGFARQDRKDRPRVAISAKMVANILTAAGASRVITMDLHADQLQGFFDVPVDHLHASSIFIPYIQQMNLDNLVIASPDTGGSKRANSYAKYLSAGLVICHKTRKIANQVADMTVIGDVKDKNVIIIDDMIDTAGTLAKAADIIRGKGAKTVRAIATHPVLSGPAYERIENSSLEEVMVTDSIPLKRQCEKIKVISIADAVADVIMRVYNNQSISSYFIF